MISSCNCFKVWCFNHRKTVMADKFEILMASLSLFPPFLSALH